MSEQIEITNSTGETGTLDVSTLSVKVDDIVKAVGFIPDVELAIEYTKQANAERNFGTRELHSTFRFKLISLGWKYGKGLPDPSNKTHYWLCHWKQLPQAHRDEIAATFAITEDK